MFNPLEAIEQFREMLIGKKAIPIMCIYTVQTELTPNNFHHDMTLIVTDWAEKNPSIKAEIKKMMQKYINEN